MQFLVDIASWASIVLGTFFRIVIDVASWALIVAGSFFTIVGALGVVRMPDVFTRMHAAGIIETLGAGLLIVGMILQTGFDLVALKLIFIYVLFFFFSPVVTHALAQAALHAGIEPRLTEDRRGGDAGRLAGAAEGRQP